MHHFTFVSKSTQSHAKAGVENSKARTAVEEMSNLFNLASFEYTPRLLRCSALPIAFPGTANGVMNCR